MTRRNVQLAFIGEPDATDQPLEALVEGDEAVEMVICGGRLLVAVPAGTPDEQLFDQFYFIGGELVLEDGRKVSFQIQDGAEGVLVGVVGNSADEHEGLSSIPNIPTGG